LYGVVLSSKGSIAEDAKLIHLKWDHNRFGKDGSWKVRSLLLP
jgi:hypothetical protein